MFEQVVDIYTVVANLIGLVICVFCYIDRPRRSWIYVTIFLMCELLSNYYWGAYVLIMDDTPVSSSFMAYFGDNLSYFPLILLLIHLRRKEDRHFFTPLCLLPVPLTAYQFTIYIQYGGFFNNLWQCFFSTMVAVISLNAIFDYVMHKKDGVKKPAVSIVLFIFIASQYAMWTSSCYDWPSEWLNPYNYLGFVVFSTLVTLPIAVARICGQRVIPSKLESAKRTRSIFKPIYLVIVLVFCVGGFFMAVWIRDTLKTGIAADDSLSATYSVVQTMLFVFSLVLVALSIMIVIVVHFVRRALQSDRLQEEKNVAEHSNEAKSEFLANMSHEIRTPINAVLGMNEMILRESTKNREDLPGDNEDIRETFADICKYSGNIESAGKNLLSIINDILDFSKIEAGKMEITDAEYHLSSLLNDVSNMIYYRAKSKGLQFDVDVDKSLPDVLRGDEVHVRQCLINVLNNAVKYTTDGGVHLRVTGKKESDVISGFMIRLVFIVKDTGIGIRKQDLEKLFSKFERVDLEKNRDVEGTGLGLAITRNLMEMMGGEVMVESVYGSGSTFTIRIPQQIIKDDPVGDFRQKFEKTLKETKAYSVKFTAPEARILVVDDTELNLTVVKGLLRDTELKIDTVKNGADAARMANATHYDLILMDQLMPKMDGSEALRIIREQRDKVNYDTPIICLTADAVVGARERYIAEGFSDYLTKPINSRLLEEMLIRYLPSEKVILQE